MLTVIAYSELPVMQLIVMTVSMLRAAMVKHVKENKLNLCKLFGLDNKTFYSLIMNFRKPAISVGELAVYCLPDVHRRDVVVHTAFSEPQTFLSTSSNNIGNPIHLAFMTDYVATPAITKPYSGLRHCQRVPKLA